MSWCAKTNVIKFIFVSSYRFLPYKTNLRNTNQKTQRSWTMFYTNLHILNVTLNFFNIIKNFENLKPLSNLKKYLLKFGYEYLDDCEFPKSKVILMNAKRHILKVNKRLVSSFTFTLHKNLWRSFWIFKNLFLRITYDFLFVLHSIFLLFYIP